MPELPEVETIVRQLKPYIENQTIDKVSIKRSSQWKNPALARKILTGSSIRSICRRAKYIDIELNDSHHLIIHLRMTGKLMLKNTAAPVERYTRTIFYLDNGTSLCFMDTRALGRLEVIGGDSLSEYFKKSGIEPLSKEFRIDRLKDMLNKSNLQIKTFLLDQKRIAGIGNIYASEILFRCGVRPERRARSMNEKEVQHLYETIPRVLTIAISKMGTTLGNKISDYRNVYDMNGEYQQLLQVYGRTNEPCHTCGNPVKRIVQNGRSSFYCTSCQK